MIVKSALLLEKHGESSVLILVDEHDEIHHLTGDAHVLRDIVEMVDLPNFRWHRISGNRVHCVGGGRYMPPMDFVKTYAKKKVV